MSSSAALRHARHLSTAAALSASSATISISKAKSKLKAEHDPDKALEIYSSVSDRYISPLSSRYAQEYTVKRLAKSHRFSDIESFLDSHKNSSQITQEPFLSSIIRSYGVAGMFDHALNIYHEMDDLGTPRSTISFNVLLSACVHSKQYDRVPHLFDEIPVKYGFLPDKVSYGILIRSYCENGSPEMAMERLKEMEEKDVEITTVTFTTILHSFYKKGKIDEAKRVWNEMVIRGHGPDVGAYNVKIMNIQGGDPEGVKALIEEMSDAGLKPDTISYNYLMTCYCKNGLMDEAQKVYEDLGSKGCNPNAATFRTLIFYLCKKGRFETGYKVFKESVRVHKIPDFSTLKYLVEGLVQRSKLKDAKGMGRTVKKKFPPNLVKAWTKLEEELGLAKLEAGDKKIKDARWRIPFI
ncbi:small ribosomal subunit protein mL103 (rPPR7)-like isoform X1 [Nicotiana tabacum]|uniref:Pentatricopeptide repeat-containing protein At4g36680, mitochondrial-like isoform X1 n=7 Tax=Nicotiana tabacum TaxID=4097 RepID=A0A1S3Z4V3_TOBAC|nr:PREDICTED: pentatricopeptide repeat-containing protein At4g36680, mitochondrial-like isoform X1 [Nicotiana tabacum]XP_016459375.1 PREDICTED: pentatricopeptide repeat-containing protein At4g36680, mitochondrial-like isoform X1 [Nicotiana tabacum]XP_016459376.1 PREDICTED: pentatricopeptide repeat-containing protein At4g36680, mitochondrial-like isoform X1 [Nicotiana tabacum]XP_016459377.1 PREDICTED: pentatricopeptide repeat-containing protein At4g36680, mitochondrial-like isoform X1 [Nicotiana 